MTTELHDLLDNDPAAGLRGVAALMRERTEAEASRGWQVEDANEGDGNYRPLWMVTNDAFHNPPSNEDEPWLAVEIHTGTKATAEHIAAADPPFILAVADWLDAEAAKQTPTTHLAVTFDGTPMFPVDPAALAVARAYLGAR